MRLRPLFLALSLPLLSCDGPAAPGPAGPDTVGAGQGPGQGTTPAGPSSAASPSGPTAGPITIGISGGTPDDNPPPAGAVFPNKAGDPCAAGAKPPKGDQLRLVSTTGKPRWYVLHVPGSYAPGPTPLVLNLHGFSSDPFQEELLTGMNAAADHRGILVAYPAGLYHSWNAGVCCGWSSFYRVDDVGFVREVIDSIATEYCVDPKRVFATGMSNGGFMSHRLACELSDRIAAAAPVAGVLGIPSCTPPRDVPVLHFHGQKDPLVPYDGSALLRFISVPATYAGWTGRDGCGGPEGTLFQNGDSTCVAHAGCGGGSEAILCTVSDGGHTWPGGFPIPFLGKTTTDMSATEMMLDFFARHPKQ